MTKTKEKDQQMGSRFISSIFLKESPVRNLLIIAAMTGLFEMMIMLFVPLHDFSRLAEALINSILLVLLLSPALHFFMFLPLSRRIVERKKAEAAIQGEHDQMEQRVIERTAELEQRNLEASLLKEMGDLFQASKTTDEAYFVIAQFAGKLFKNQTGALFLRNPSGTDLEAQASWGDWPDDFQAQVIPNDECWALRLGRIRVETDQSTVSVCRHDPSPGCGHICVPMSAHGETLGVLYLQLQNHLEDNSASVQEVERLAVSLTEQVSLALVNLRLRETLRFQSIRDPLTGLFNRRYMEETLERELPRAERTKKDVGVIMMDIDHFKQFNDTFGHDAGDAVLREFGILLKNHSRVTDIACRYGGEEFILILPETPLEVVQERAENLRVKVKQMSVRNSGQLLGSISLSCGISLYPKHETNAESLIQLADQALYQAKQAGRDQVVVANSH